MLDKLVAVLKKVLVQLDTLEQKVKIIEEILTQLATKPPEPEKNLSAAELFNQIDFVSSPAPQINNKPIPIETIQNVGKGFVGFKAPNE